MSSRLSSKSIRLGLLQDLSYRMGRHQDLSYSIDFLKVHTVFFNCQAERITFQVQGRITDKFNLFSCTVLVFYSIFLLLSVL